MSLVFCTQHLSGSFPHFHSHERLVACGNVENLKFIADFHRQIVISTAFSTAPVENKRIVCNSKVSFPHFHRPYYYYCIYF